MQPRVFKQQSSTAEIERHKEVAPRLLFVLNVMFDFLGRIEKHNLCAGD